MEVIYGNLHFYAVSIYFDITVEIENSLIILENILKFVGLNGVVMAMDSNARSRMWHDVMTNKRGRKMEEFLMSNQLHLINEESDIPTFESRTGTVSYTHLDVYKRQESARACNGVHL